jgi:hypothetical protein
MVSLDKVEKMAVKVTTVEVKEELGEMEDLLHLLVLVVEEDFLVMEQTKLGLHHLEMVLDLLLLMEELGELQ